MGYAYPIKAVLSSRDPISRMFRVPASLPTAPRIDKQAVRSVVGDDLLPKILPDCAGQVPWAGAPKEREDLRQSPEELLTRIRTRMPNGGGKRSSFRSTRLPPHAEAAPRCHGNNGLQFRESSLDPWPTAFGPAPT